MTASRIRRPLLDRTTPVRNWSTLFYSKPHGARVPQPNPVPTSTPSAQVSPPTAAAVASALADDASRDAQHAVDMGYRVIEEYMRLGAAAAERASHELHALPGLPSPQWLFERLLQSASDLGSVWLELLEALWTQQHSAPTQHLDPGGFDLQPRPSTTAHQAADRQPSFSQPNIALRVLGGRDVEVSTHVHAELGHGPFLVHALHGLQPELPPIRQVSLTYQLAQSRALLTLHIPSEQPLGVYTGVIVGADHNQPLGTVSVCVR